MYKNNGLDFRAANSREKIIARANARVFFPWANIVQQGIRRFNINRSGRRTIHD